MISHETLTKITNKKFSDQFLVVLNNVLVKYEINTPLRVSHFLAQLLHESGNFRYKEEIWGNTPAQRRYDTRVDLGNTPELDGDGKLYKGRGYIQLTGKANYKKYSQYTGIDFVSNPAIVAELPHSLDVSGWFWATRKLNTYADQDNIKAVTKRVNGGYNGLEDRVKWLAKCKSVFNIA